MKEITTEWLRAMIAWTGFESSWEKTAYAAAVQAKYDEAKTELNKVRAQVVRKGRPVGWRKPAKDAA